jgi:hypothetical protein
MLLGMSNAVIVLTVSGQQYPMTEAEAARLVEYLRAPNEYVAESDPGMLAAAVFLERLMGAGAEEGSTLTGEECAGLLIALGRMDVQEGLTADLAAVREALLGYLEEPTTRADAAF